MSSLSDHYAAREALLRVDPGRDQLAGEMRQLHAELVELRALAGRLLDLYRRAPHADFCPANQSSDARCQCSAAPFDDAMAALAGRLRRRKGGPPQDGEGVMGELTSNRPQTPWRVICPRHFRVYLTCEEYNAQMASPNTLWKCPLCGLTAEWDDANYERACDEAERRSFQND